MSQTDQTKGSQPTRIGPYRILEVIGEGGMGTVYLAEQKEPVRRRAALKVIKLGMDSKAVLMRFEAERKALAMMEHSCIATVFDAGITPQGQPFFAMEYVKGIPITDYCDLNKLGLKERIELFQKVCSGVQHAHLKGVMHRDLKPSNVLVTLQDGKPTPKIIDFGLAKATDHHLVDGTLFTEQGQVIGTPEYMSPEQAGLGGLDVDTRTDVYSLGVLLYELMVGELPFSRKDLRNAGMLEMQRVIREQEPVKPSTRITALGESAGQHAAARKLDLGDLQKNLRGDLDWIVVKAMEKDRTRRYETALELSGDLQRHLSFEPVLASPPSLAYRVKKFVRRYRVQCAAAAVVLVAIVGGGIGTWLGFAEASRRAESESLAKADAQQNERLANQRAEENGRLARAESAAKAEAQKSEQLAKDRADQIAAMAQKDRVYADTAKLAEARTIEAELYPAFPDKAVALREWLANYGGLAARLPELEAQLTALRQKAKPRKEAERAAMQKEHARAPDLVRLRSQLDNESNDARRAELREQIELLEHEIAVAGYEFVDSQDAYLHRSLTRLVRELRAFAKEGPVGERGLLADVRARQSEAEGVQQKTIAAHQRAWDEAIATIAGSDDRLASKLYEHFLLTPQPGLVPIGMDRESKLWEFVHLASGSPGQEIPVRDPTTHRLIPTGDMGLVFVLLPGGTLPDLPPDEHGKKDPRLSVQLDPYFLSKYEMTQGQWLRLTGRNPSASAKENSPALPVETVSWLDCEELLRHQGWVLPSELQWEYGCRAGTTTAWWTGATEESLRDMENFGGMRLVKGTEVGGVIKGFAVGGLFRIGSCEPNRFGLFDVAGNLWEWCRDEFGDYGTEHAGDGLRTQGDAFERPIRGGHFDCEAKHVRSDSRIRGKLLARSAHVGIRPARASRL